MVYSKRKVRFYRHNHTQKTHSNHASIHGNVVKQNENGWKIIHVYGSPFQRGFAHGYLLHRELSKLKRAFIHLFSDLYDPKDYPMFQTICRTQITPFFRTHYSEYYTELQGMVAGAKHAGVHLSLAFLLEWNSLLSVDGALPSAPPAKHRRRREKCSAFIAAGKSTKHGDMVMAHNTHCPYSFAPFSHIVQYMTPENGYAFCMQTLPGLICSSVDWFMTGAGIIGCESTLPDVSYRPDFSKTPYFCRIRDCMQYANSLEEYAKRLMHSNAGDYPCAWLLGDINTGEIMLMEIAYKTHHIERNATVFSSRRIPRLNAKPNIPRTLSQRIYTLLRVHAWYD